jgi:sirohydrochlorin ferrochelatase
VSLVGVVIVDHGSVRAEANHQLERFVESFRAVSPVGIVEAAHMELAEPSIASAFRRCVERGAGRIVVIPYFLGPGKHWREDIPRLAGEASRELGGVGFRVGEPIGLHPMMLEVVRARLDECLR